jgi:hypothetical protein
MTCIWHCQRQHWGSGDHSDWVGEALASTGQQRSNPGQRSRSFVRFRYSDHAALLRSDLTPSNLIGCWLAFRERRDTPICQFCLALAALLNSLRDPDRTLRPIKSVRTANACLRSTGDLNFRF